jgi:NAD(P)H dehydrogenase (quinone)
VRFGDFTDPASLREAFAGGRALLLISTDAVGTRLPHQRAAVEAAREAGVEHMLYTSVPNPVPENPAGVVPDHAGTEEAILASGLKYTFLRNALYGDLRLGEAQGAIATGELHHNMGDGKTAFVAREDCAAAAAAVLADVDAHLNKVYDITGPVPLGAAELAALYAELGGRPVVPVALDDDAYVAGLVAHAGLPEPFARLLASFGIAIREGHLGQATTTVQELTGRAPLPLGAVLEEALAAA